MNKVKLVVIETLKYEREIIVEVPEGISEIKLSGMLDAAERAGQLDGVDGFVGALKRRGIVVSGGYDTDLDSPSSVEAECFNYEILKGGSE